MATIRLSQTRGDASDRFQVRVDYEGDGARRSALAVVSLTMSEQDHKDIRWYLEDYLEAAYEPEREIAAKVERRMHELGEALFQATFQGCDDARDLWAMARSDLADTRIEIETSVTDAAALPWELLRDPRTNQPLALGAAEFVRVQSQRSRTPLLPKPQKKGKVRILLAICRPSGPTDVPYRSVASRLVKGLTAQGRERVQLDILRPPTYARLAKVLRQAKENNAPYHVVHFDGHGLYADAEDVARIKAGDSFDAHSFKGPDSGAHGYLAFEHPDGNDDAIEPIGGAQLGNLLYETGVPVLVLNACRSAYAEHSATPAAGDDHHDMVQAYGSLAQEVVEQGVAGVVAMRYNVYVVTAAQFIADLYRVLAEGHSLGRAVTRGRKALNDAPARAISDPPIPLQDWPVPILYEAAPLHLFPKTKAADLFAVRDNATMAAGDDELPRPPDVGFFGRDETLLTLDRAFDRHPIALLHAYAGSGKTSTAAEFARWYRDTGGLGEGVVLFDSFERHRTVRDLVDKLGGVFAPLLHANNIEWLTLNDAQRYRLSLDILRQIPVLWVWDNVEPVAGFPAGAESPWTPDQQRELADFLRDLAGTRAKLLLTSRRDERAWLGDLPTRWAMPAMPHWERRALAEELIRRHRRPPNLVQVLAPLLTFSAGNPMTLTVVVGQALRDRLSTREQVTAYVTKLRAGTAAFPDDTTQGRDRSLGASLAYGFQAAFSDEERCRLALLHLFQGFVDVNVLCWMGHPDNPACLDSLRGLTRDAGIALLDRAAEIGLLMAHDDGFYGIHPAVPWFLHDLFDTCYPAPARRAVQAYVEAIGEMGITYFRHFREGHHQALGHLRAEEHNLLHARRLALAEDWWAPCYGAMAGLRFLYTSAGQWAGWARLVAEAAALVTAADGGPQPGREGNWLLATEYAVELAGQRRDGAESERLLRLTIAVLRGRVADLLDRPADNLTATECNRLRSLGVSLQRLGVALMVRNNPDALAPLREAHDLSRHLADRTAEAAYALTIGQAYQRIDAVRDLAKAERWTRDSMALRDDHDRAGRAKCYRQLGQVASARFDALPATVAPQERVRLLNDAAQAYQTSLDLRPIDDLAGRTVSHHELATVYKRAGQPDAAMAHYKQSIGLKERLGNRHGAGRSRFNLARLLASTGRFSDALAYARAARADFASYDGRAAAEVADTDALIALIEKDLAAS